MSKTYRQMYETRNVRPYYTVVHLGVFGKALRGLTGFAYKDTVYVTSADMNNAAYFDVAEMKRAQGHFARIWKDNAQTKKILKTIYERLQLATVAEGRAWKQNWRTKTDRELRAALRQYYDLLWQVFAVMIVSQPQHVASLEERINFLVKNKSNADEVLRAATHVVGSHPWDKEDREITKLHRGWKKMSATERREALSELVKTYGWYNTVEGKAPFDAAHYRKKILEWQAPTRVAVNRVVVPMAVLRIGQLVGELGHLRFWTRWHFMHVRYHLNAIRQELIRRAKRPELEYATIEELTTFLDGKPVDISEMKRRARGYTSVLRGGSTKILTGKEAQTYVRAVTKKTTSNQEVRGNIASPGRAVGHVRIISFSAKDYEQQVTAFKKGEILVTGMTRPQIVHLCNRAAAIVTDEGGITSHAAVVSRELGIPCVIGTGNATKIFKTGDRVEVDATRGVIKKI